MTEWLQSWFKEIFDNGAFAAVEDVLKLDPSQELGWVWTAVETIYNNVMVPLALGLMVIWFLVAFIKTAASEQVTFEQLFMLFVKLIAAKFLIDNGLQILADFWSLGISLVDNIKGAIPPPDDPISFSYKSLWQDLTGVEWGTSLNLMIALGVMCQLLIPWLVSKVLIACVYFICYSRLIEMFVRMLAAPIALSDFFAEGLHGAGWRFLKNFLAICLQGVLIGAIAQLYPLIMAELLTGSGSFWTVTIKYIAFSFSAVALMFKSLSLSKELVGTS